MAQLEKQNHELREQLQEQTRVQAEQLRQLQNMQQVHIQMMQQQRDMADPGCTCSINLNTVQNCTKL